MKRDRYDLFSEFMQRYEAGERELNDEEKRTMEFLASDGRAFSPLAFSVFLQNMQRYEAGERELNKEEKDWLEYLASSGSAISFSDTPSFYDFLVNMERYQNEKSVGKHR